MVHGCMVYTERAETTAVSRGTSHVKNQAALYVHHFGSYSKRFIKSLSHTFSITCATKAQWVCSRAENSAISNINAISNIYLPGLLRLIPSENVYTPPKKKSHQPLPNVDSILHVLREDIIPKSRQWRMPFTRCPKRTLAKHLPIDQDLHVTLPTSPQRNQDFHVFQFIKP